jgi:hypothetical protein
MLPFAIRGMGGTAMTEPRKSAGVTGVVFKANPWDRNQGKQVTRPFV